MSFSTDMKDEMVRLPLGKSCCMLSELSALTQTSGSLSLQGRGRVRVTYRVENAALARRLYMLLRTQLNVSPRLHFSERKRLGGQKSCVLTLENNDAQTLLIALHMMEKTEDGEILLRRTVPRHPLTRQCCRKAFLRAAFLGTGSVTSPEKGYHMEWIAEDENLSEMLCRLLEKAEIVPKVYERRGQHVVYLKNGQQIVDTIAMMGASRAVFTMEDARITRQARGRANRAFNCDEHNTEKMLSAGRQQLEDIRLIEKTQGLETLPENLRRLAQLRLDYYEMSLVQLGEMMDPPLGKSGVNHRMRRIREIAEEIRQRVSR